MLPGPVFHVELITTARRARYYAIRFLYGMLLLYFVGVAAVPTARNRALWEGGELSIAEMAETGQRLFITLTVFQWVAVLVLTPAVVAGVVADEKRRKTLQYLMASHLNSAEIILGKLFARLLHVAVFLAIGLPVMSLISLFGGVEPVQVVLVYLGTFSTACFLAALAILVSTLARRPRDANAQVYVLELAWLFGPALVAEIATAGGPRWLGDLYEWIRPINEPLLRSSPLALIVAAAGPDPVANSLWMVSSQVVLAGLFALLAIVLLRPIVRREGDGARRAGWLGWSRRRRRHRPEVFADPMFWKERYVARTRGAMRLLIGIVLIAGGMVLGYATLWIATPAFAELWWYGFSAEQVYLARRVFNQYLRTVGALVYVAWCLGAASLAATGVAAEREEDTWTSLTTTPLSGEEILRAKMFGAVWGTRGFGYMLLVLWLLGLASGAVHPIGLVAVMAETAVFLWFVAALGTTLSLAAKSSARAQSATIAILLGLNGLYLFCCIPLRPDTIFFALGVTPLIEGLSLVGYEDISRLTNASNPQWYPDAVMTCVFGVLFYAAAALVLTVDAFASFDSRIDRPRRGWDQPYPSSKGIRFIDDDT